ncbi:hypothetical protein ABCR94_28305 [Streptomyces sp. 21So2-11]|uniref:hypothetical protein n=1 Tax=Streptomyces sp. 21So2-11 TaxID=3144408 RepID=UPI00321B8290
MASDPAPTPVRRAVSPLDHRIEAVTGHDVDTLWAHRDRGVLDAPHARLVDRHRELAQAQTGVTFYRTLLHRLSSGEFDVDSDLFESIDRAVDQLEEAAKVRYVATRRVFAALEPIEATSQRKAPDGPARLSAIDHAALVSVEVGARVQPNLFTDQMYVTTTSGNGLAYADLQRVEAAGLVARDTTQSVEAGQWLTLTDTGRTALAVSRSHRTAAPPVAPRPATSPTAPTRPHR